MKSFPRYILPLFIALISTRSFGQTGKAPVNYLTTPSALSFNNVAFNLSWSAHPSPAYYKQEYLPKGETLNRFNSMLLLELLISPTTIREAMGAKIAELQQMKKGNPYISYDSSYNAAKGEYLLDFVLTANTPDGKGISIAEKNVYRYKKYTGENGETGVLLFGISKRSYGNEAAGFIAAMGTKRSELIKQVELFVIPPITVKK